jgi:predicted O-methyltransferase YrrM
MVFGGVAEERLQLNENSIWAGPPIPQDRAGGLVLIDNVLRDGEVADPTIDTPVVRAIRALNAKLRDDPRIDLSLLPLADGLTIALKR